MHPCRKNAILTEKTWINYSIKLFVYSSSRAIRLTYPDFDGRTTQKRSNMPHKYSARLRCACAAYHHWWQWHWSLLVTLILISYDFNVWIIVLKIYLHDEWIKFVATRARETACGLRVFNSKLSLLFSSLRKIIGKMREFSIVCVSHPTRRLSTSKK